MKRKSTSTKFYLTLLLLIAVTSLKAQVITDLAGLGAGKAICPSTAVSLTAAATGASTYTWNRYAGKLTVPTGTATPITGTGTGATITDTPPTAGYYTYFSTSTNATGCTSDPSAPTVIYVLPAITVSITTPTAIAYCVNSAPPTNTTLTAVASLSPTTSENLGLTYQWQKAGADISGATASTYILDNTDIATTQGSVIYTVKVGFAVPNTCGTVTPATGTTITINALPGIPIVTIN
jgi:hypothetical protein